MGRSPCCEKVGLKKGPWTPEEDQRLLAYIEEHGHGSWRALPVKAGLQRCGKSCRLRWTNYLRPDIKRGKFSLQEEQTIIQLHALLGNRWAAIATSLPKRTDNEIKNYWNTHLKKRLTKMGIDPVTHKPKSDALDSANLSHMAQWENARLEAETRLARESKLRSNSLQRPQQQQQATTSASSSSLSSSAQLLNKMATQPAANALCLDVFAKAWQGNNSNSTISGSILGLGSTQVLIGSPTSTLSFSESSIPNPCVGFDEKSMAGTEFVQNLVNFGGGTQKEGVDYNEECLEDVAFAHDGQWTSESLKIGDGQEPVLNFADYGFTDLVLGHSDIDQEYHSLNGGGRESNNADGWNWW